MQAVSVMKTHCGPFYSKKIPMTERFLYGEEYVRHGLIAPWAAAMHGL
jgi:hypothetical protein